MRALSFLLYYTVIIPVSLLPFRVLQAISFLFFIFIYHIAAYRKKVVIGNIRNSFPQESAAFHEAVCKKFYRHFTDLLLESFKTFTISEGRLAQHLYCRNPEVANKYFEQGKSVIITVGHYNSWEFFLTGINSMILHQAVVIYQPLTNSFFDEKICRSRSDHGTKMISVKEVKQFFEAGFPSPQAIVFAIDQSPSDPSRCYWMNFLHQETGVLYGAEYYAKKYDLPVIYARINKERRGYYSLELFDVCEDSAKSEYGYITTKSTRMLEKDILAHPQYWLWSHRRWKHKKPAGFVKTQQPIKQEI